MKQNNRYIRQTILKGFGPGSQEKLKKSSVLVVGAGGLGIPVLQYLNAMGVGAIGIVDGDKVSLSNLHRQVLYTESDIGESKVQVLAERLHRQNSSTVIHTYETYLSTENALELIAPFDLVIDATDNFPTRYLINDACVILDKPFIYGALHGYEGQVSVFNYNDGPTYRCLFPDMPSAGQIPDCNTNGVLGILPGIVGNLQALEAVKVISGVGEVLSGKLLIFDSLTHQYRKITFPVVPENLVIKKLQGNYGVNYCTNQNISSDEFDSIVKGNLQLIDVRTPEEFESFHFEPAKNIPVMELDERRGEIDITKSVCFVCQSGIRSQKAIDIFNANPAVEVFHLEGGINAYLEWQSKFAKVK
ncbi:HesA/MoeB/ThiF family protein [Membranihabitans maritimus]|uniref:HesA/MoeB/ThiF family protein n=1 Tax=Membranihabitans maritimus TaxID=2904244 RepID=UPI001F2DF5F9|nr:HesA/MoeB/ThiF family protein [Membranihabitans maritimus]